MIRLIVFVSLLIPAAALAQSGSITSPTDQEIADRYTFCHKPEHFVMMGTRANKIEGGGDYKPEYKEACHLVDAEHQKRDLAAKAKQADDLKQLNSVKERLSK